MRLLILKDKESVAKWSARYVSETLREKQSQNQKLVLGLPTGGSIEGTYKELSRIHQEEKLDFSSTKTFNMDEYRGLNPEHPQSYHYFMQKNLFSHTNFSKENIHIPDGLNPDAKSACDAYEKSITQAGGIDLFLGGVGEDGHIAFNEPGSSLCSRTRVKTLTQETIQSNARFFDGDTNQVPTQAITIGVQTLMDAKQVMILAQGYNKAKALSHAIEGSINHFWTITALQMHPSALIVCDIQAANELSLKTIRYFQNLKDEFSEFTQKHFQDWDVKIHI